MHVAERQEALPRLAEAAIRNVRNDFFPNAVLDNFPNPHDQAGLVRNMIASLAFRGTPNPVITIYELLDFVNNNEGLLRLARMRGIRFGEEIQDRSILMSPLVQEYLNDLTNQIIARMYRFLKTYYPSNNLSYEMIITRRDQLYRAFSDILLLVHPALEEREIIIDPAKARDYDYSLWQEDLSVVFGNARFPTKLALEQARRLFKAKGDVYQVKRFEEGIRAWRLYENSKRYDIKALQELQQKELTLQARLEKARNGDKLPSFAYSLAASLDQRSYQERQYARRKFNRLHQIIIDARNARDDMISLLSYAQSQEKVDNYPEPPSRSRKRLIREKSRRSRSGSLGEEQLDKASQLVHEYLFAQEELVEESDRDKLNQLEQEDIVRKITATAELVENIRNGSVPLPEYVTSLSLVDIYSFLDRYSEKINQRTLYNRKGGLAIKGDSKRIRASLSMVRRLNFLQERGQPLEAIQREFYVFLLNDRLAIYRQILEGVRSISFADTPISESPAYLTREEFETWVREVRVATLPSDVTDFSNLSTYIPQIRQWLRDYGLDLCRVTTSALLPEEKENYRRILQSRQELAQRKIDSWQTQNVMTRHNFQAAQRAKVVVKTIEGMLWLLDYPFFPYEEGVGLTEQVFWIAVQKRLQLIDALVSLDQAKQFYTHTQKTFEHYARQAYENYLQNKLAMIRRQILDKSLQLTAERKLRQRMEELNLVKLTDAPVSNN
jgi:hypothetical protein